MPCPQFSIRVIEQHNCFQAGCYHCSWCFALCERGCKACVLQLLGVVSKDIHTCINLFNGHVFSHKLTPAHVSELSDMFDMSAYTNYLSRTWICVSCVKTTQASECTMSLLAPISCLLQCACQGSIAVKDSLMHHKRYWWVRSTLIQTLAGKCDTSGRQNEYNLQVMALLTNDCYDNNSNLIRSIFDVTTDTNLC